MRQPAPERSGGKGRGGYLRSFGPGIIAGASDNDPTTVATLAVVGASTVYSLSWMVVLLLPMLSAVQMISARVGVVTRHGLQTTARSRYGRLAALPLLLSVLAVNLVTLGADLSAGTAALHLLLPVDHRLFTLPYAALLAAALIFGSYATAARVLRYVVLVFVVYIGAAFASGPDWGRLLHDTLLPRLSLGRDYVEGMLALLGTTLTSYAYVWETIEEAEEGRPASQIGPAQTDAGIGMSAAVVIFWFIIITTGTTLGLHHQQVQTAQDAASALRPVAGAFAATLFALGLLASATIAVPVLAATSAYIVCEQLGVRHGLKQRPREAKAFYTVIAATLALGALIDLLGLSPIRLLFVASLAGGLGTPISLGYLLRLARDHGVMQEHRIGPLLTAIGWGTAALVTAVSLYFLAQQLGVG